MAMAILMIAANTRPVTKPSAAAIWQWFVASPWLAPVDKLREDVDKAMEAKLPKWLRLQQIFDLWRGHRPRWPSAR
jgi:hypothetical protein